jgi:hypothetical protein
MPRAKASAKFGAEQKGQQFGPRELVTYRQTKKQRSVWVVRARLNSGANPRQNEDASPVVAICLYCDTDQYDVGEQNYFRDNELEPFYGTITIKGDGHAA